MAEIPLASPTPSPTTAANAAPASGLTAVQVSITNVPDALENLIRIIQMNATPVVVSNANTVTLATALGNITVALSQQLASAEKQSLTQQLMSLVPAGRALTLTLQPGNPPTQGALLMPTSPPQPVQQVLRPLTPPPPSSMPQLAAGENFRAIVLPPLPAPAAVLASASPSALASLKPINPPPINEDIIALATTRTSDEPAITPQSGPVVQQLSGAPVSSAPKAVFVPFQQPLSAPQAPAQPQANGLMPPLPQANAPKTFASSLTPPSAPQQAQTTSQTAAPQVTAPPPKPAPVSAPQAVKTFIPTLDLPPETLAPPQAAPSPPVASVTKPVSVQPPVQAQQVPETPAPPSQPLPPVAAKPAVAPQAPQAPQATAPVQPPQVPPQIASLLKPGNEVLLRVVAVLPSVPDAPTKQATAALPQLAPNQIIATVTGTGTSGQLILKAGDATLFVKAQVSAPTGTSVVVSVDNVKSTPLMTLPASSDDLNFRALPQLFAALEQANPALFQHVVSNLMPQPSAALPGALMFLLSAFKQGNLRDWLGNDAIETLIKAGKSALVDSLAKDMASAGQISQDPVVGTWRSYPIPLYTHQQFQSLTLHVHGDRDARKEQQGASGAGKIRFLIDMRLTKLGEMQIDGFVQPKKLDMILRSEAILPEGLHHELRTSYINALSATGYTGTLNFQVGRQHWMTMKKAAPAGIVT